MSKVLFILCVVFALGCSSVPTPQEEGFPVSDQTNDLYLRYLRCAGDVAKKQFYETVELNELVTFALSKCEARKLEAVESLRNDARLANAMALLPRAERELEQDVMKHLRAEISDRKSIERREWLRYGP